MSPGASATVALVMSGLVMSGLTTVENCCAFDGSTKLGSLMFATRVFWTAGTGLQSGPSAAWTADLVMTSWSLAPLRSRFRRFASASSSFI